MHWSYVDRLEESTNRWLASTKGGMKGWNPTTLQSGILSWLPWNKDPVIFTNQYTMYTPEKWTPGPASEKRMVLDTWWCCFSNFRLVFSGEPSRSGIPGCISWWFMPCQGEPTGFLGAKKLEPKKFHQEVGDFTVNAIIGEENQWLDSRFLGGRRIWTKMEETRFFFIQRWISSRIKSAWCSL